MAKLSANMSVPRDTLVAVADARLRESLALRAAHHPAGAIYLGGYAVECYLKAAICRTLDLDALPNTFKSHALDALLMHSGHKKRLEHGDAAVHDSFQKILGMWKIEETEEPTRYTHPSKFSNDDAEAFEKWLIDPVTGIIPWLQKQI